MLIVCLVVCSTLLSSFKKVNLDYPVVLQYFNVFYFQNTSFLDESLIMPVSKLLFVLSWFYAQIPFISSNTYTLCTMMIIQM